MLYPLKFEPIYKEKIWGGINIGKKFQRNLCKKKRIGESWEIACRENGDSRVINGFFKNYALSELIKKYDKKLLGRGYARFPLLVKIIDASQKLSVQVHPDDEYARINEDGESGKTEMWYIIDALPGSKLVLGLKNGVCKEDFRKALEEGCLHTYLNEIEVQPGDVLYIPAGMLHAIGEGILLAEVQQNSDTTYRVYDWNRVGSDGKPRELHVDKALEVIDFEGKLNGDKVEGLEIEGTGYTKKYLIANPYFTVELLNIKENILEQTGRDKFFIYMVVEGEADIYYEDGSEHIEAGETVLIPAYMDEFKVEGNSKILKTYVANLKKDVINFLLSKGFARRDLCRIGGLEYVVGEL
ncbi:MAG: mannose-6-phosphate isomerase [Thermosediminibacterales bacterium]|nr:mannose-6-phosphate isomerase [Thermosediminibacterales bacterium]MDK2835592.1 mannose-6-phosphate isomerase [Thermosediminibacterales bacterium]